MFAEKLETINYDNIILCDPLKNSIIEHSNFYKVIYSNSYISYNGIYCIFELNNITLSKDRVFFNNNENTNISNYLVELEKYITNLCNRSKTKNINYKLKEFLSNNYLKFVNNDDVEKFNNFNSYLTNNSNSNYFILKIAGLWETKENIGMTFKIIKVNKFI